MPSAHNAIDKIAQSIDPRHVEAGHSGSVRHEKRHSQSERAAGFRGIGTAGQFSRAAEELSLTHSAVYRQVASLEARLGVQLFTRVRRRIALTEHGAEYAGRIRHHLDQIEKDTFGLVSRTGMGRSIHIAVVPTLATTWLIPRLPDFQRAHPDITVSLSVRTLPFQFKDQPFDGALYHGDGLWPGTQGALLFPERELVPVCAPSWPRASPAEAPRRWPA